MKLELGAPLSYDPQNIQLTVKRLFDAYFELTEKLEHMTRYLDSENIAELTADKITAGTIKVLIKILGPEIIGGIIKTASTGKRVEISENQIKCYNKDGQLNGFCIDNTDAQSGDASFYSKGEKIFTVFNSFDNNFTLKPEPGKSITIGSTEGTVGLLNSFFWDSVTIIEQTAPDPEEGKIKFYFNGTNVKAVFPDGTEKTINMT